MSGPAEAFDRHMVAQEAWNRLTSGLPARGETIAAVILEREQADRGIAWWIDRLGQPTGAVTAA